MALKISYEVKSKAIELRRQGKAYKDIALYLDGAVSVDWCKRNLQSVEKDKDLQWVVEQLVLDKAKTRYGCTNKEIVAIIQDVKGKLCVNEDDEIEEHVEVSALKRRLSSRDKDVLFRPEFINKHKPSYSLDLMLEYANELHDVLNQFASRYSLNVFGSECAINSNYIIYELLSLSHPKFSKWGVEQRCEYLSCVVKKLNERS